MKSGWTRRAALVAGGLLVAVFSLTASPAHATGSFVDNGNGTLTLTWNFAYSSGNQAYLQVCPGTVTHSNCLSNSGSTNRIFIQSTDTPFYAALGASPTTIDSTTVFKGMLNNSLQSNGPIGNGRFTFTYTQGDGATLIAYADNVLIGTLSVASGDSPDQTPWLQAYQRQGSAENCRSGWSPSWQQWPANGAGGWVCTRTVLAYAPLGSET